MTDKTGMVEIQYPNFSKSDSIIFSCIGYKLKIAPCIYLKKNEEFILKPEIYKIKEVVIKPKNVKTVKLGNRNIFTIQSAQVGFNYQKALYIPNKGIKGKISSVRIYMHDFWENNWKFRPFRLRLYEGGYPFVNEITKETIIASLEPKRNHWVEIDLSNFNFDFPENGILVAVQALSAKYYKEYAYIKHDIVKQRLNSLSVGFTLTKKSSLDIQSWDHYSQEQGWIKNSDFNPYYLIQIEVELYE
ncbi:MAG: hypothetical protein IMY72_11240 [Bacteroidetes bacterium]|nr:hypothetical protein [Bacteroidota bacterium]